MDKIDFYASLAVRELLIVERESKAMHLYRLAGERLREVPSADGWLECRSVGLAFRGGSEDLIEARTLDAPTRIWSF
jgi:hypothetical protein